MIANPCLESKEQITPLWSMGRVLCSNLQQNSEQIKVHLYVKTEMFSKSNKDNNAVETL